MNFSFGSAFAPAAAEADHDGDESFTPASRSWALRSLDVVELHPSAASGVCTSMAGYCGEEVLRLAVSSVDIFMSVQETVETHDTDDRLYAELAVHSRNYRAALDACARDLNRALELQGQHPSQSMTQLQQALVILSGVWHITEIFHIDFTPVPAGWLVQWLRGRIEGSMDRELREAEQHLAQQAGVRGRPEEESWYYDLIRHLLLRGEAHRAAAALRTHSKYGDQEGLGVCVAQVVELMERMPFFAATTPETQPGTTLNIAYGCVSYCSKLCKCCHC
jgi:Nup85 Nucleoporin